MAKGEKTNGGIHVMMCGQEFVLRPPVIVDPYEKAMVRIRGLSPILGPTAPNLDTYIAILNARVKAGLLSAEIRDKLLEEVRGKQVARMLSDANGDAADQIAVETVSATTHAFARDADGVLGLLSYAFRACLRECFSESGFYKKNPGSRERFREGLGIWPLFLQLKRDGKPITVADEIRRDPVHTYVGPKKVDSITHREAVNLPWEMDIMLEARHDSPLKLADAVRLLSLGRTVALGAGRSQGWGRFELVGASDVVAARCDAPLVRSIRTAATVQ